MRGKKLLKRAFAAFLAVATIITQQSITGYGLNNVQAADGSWVATSYVTNGDFESGSATGWTTTSAATTTVKTDSYATNNKTNIFNIYTTTDSTAFSMSQDITLPAGQYYISAKSEGIAHDALYTLSLGGVASKTLSASTGWDVWTTDQTDSFTLSADTTLTLSISGTLTLGSATEYWSDLDDIVIYKWQDAPKYAYTDLTTLIASVPSDYTNMGFTATSTTALTNALATANACTSATDSATIESAYTTLSTALDGLVFDGTVFVQKISGYSKDSIRGVDVSSYLSLMDAFDEINSTITDESKKVGFRDWDGNLLTRQGFFDLLADSGVNYVRLRVWNDPYSSTDATHGYGGGNNNLTTAVTMGQYATNAGMKTLIDFHFSDFWADPGKQKAPKAWSAYSVSEKATAISGYVTSSLNTLKTAGVDVGMVQIGNETTGGLCGETIWANMNTLFDAGCDAIHAFNTANSTSILAVLHFTNPEKAGKYTTIAANLAAYDGDGDATNEGVSYDVFASSYYPYWHGTMTNLTSVLSTIATTYDKYVMVAETSWATTYSDGDGHENTINDSGDLGSNATYSATVQGQANEVHDVMAAVSGVNVTLKNGDKAGLGMFYWEPAWIPVQYAYNSDGTLNSTTLASNKTLWEKYGCGWASSYASEYDAKDAGAWYGGSAVDNQAMFDFSGNPLGSLNVFKYAAYGATATLAIDAYTCSPVSVEVGTTVTGALLPSTVTVTYNDSTTADLAPSWNADDISKIATAAQKNSGIGSYTVNGTVTLADSSTYPVKCTVSVIAKNILTNYSFESASTGWTVGGSGCSIITADAKTGTKAAKFYKSTAFSCTVSQTVTVTDSGFYNGYMYIQGGAGTGSNSGESIYLTATTSSGKTYTSDNITLGGWKVWKKPTVSDIAANAGDTITLTMYVTAAAGSWGTVDDACLYLGKALATSLTLDQSTLSIHYGSTASLTCTTDQDASFASTFASSDTTVATVDSKGIVTAVGAGTATITASTTDGSSLNAACTVTVAPKSFSTDSGINIALEHTSYFYDGTEKTPTVVVTDNGTTLKEGTDYTVAYSENTNIGTATVTITGMGNYIDSTSSSFTIAKPSSLTLDQSALSIVYGNSANLTYTTDQNALAALAFTSSDTSVATVDASGKVTAVGVGIATVTAATTDGSNTSATCKVTVTARNISTSSSINAALDSSSYSYDGTAKTPVVTVTDNGAVLKNGTDYTVAYAGNTSVGTATVTITGTGNYIGSITKNFVIAKASRNIKVKTSSYTKVYGSKAFSLNAAISGGGKLSYSSSNKKVATVNSSGKVTLIGYGKATITITSSATSSFNAASAKVTVTVTPKATSLSSVKSTKAGKMTVTWKKGSAASGYLLTYSTSKNFANAKTVTVKSANTTSQNISKLSKGKTYYVKVCSYKTVSGKKIYSSDSSVKKVTIKKK